MCVRMTRRRFLLSLVILGVALLAGLVYLLFTIPVNYSLPVHGAAFSNDLARVKDFVDRDPSQASARDSLLRTPLHYAAAHGSQDMVHFLRSKGADINAKDSYGWTPLHFAVGSVRKETVVLLVEVGADVNAKDRNGRTPIATRWRDGSGEEWKEIEDYLRQHGGHE